MNFTSKYYLPNSEKRIEKLQKIVDGRPVAILAAGPSVRELEKRICELRNADICYFGLNNFSVQETHILQQIDKRFSVIMCSSREGMPDILKSIIDFLNRDEDNMFISSFWRNTFELMATDFNLNQFLIKYDKKLIFFGISHERPFPNSARPLHFILGNSLSVLIQLAIIGKASRIILFGADGSSKKNTEDYYYRQGDYPASPRENLINDTNKYFNPIAPIAIRNVYKTYKLPPIDILNCSENSFYTPFPNVSYDDAFDYILRGKKLQREMDLRIPKASIISSCLNTEYSVKETIENISNQSYSNHEHIIVYGEANDKIRDLKHQFPYVRWISEKNIKYLQAFKKGISMARGDYIFYCRITDGYLNQDWFNTCIEVLENNPDISLVWGLSQNMYEDGALGRIIDANFFDNTPPQRKKFIYYWLKKKVLFPEGNFCVRKKVLEECFPFCDSKASDEREAWIAFNYNFNTSGYQPYFIPIIANYCRTQSGIEVQKQSTYPKTQNLMKEYYEEIEQYKKQLIEGKIVHHYRNGSGELLPDGFNRSIFLFFDTGRYIKDKLPNVCLSVIEKALNYWRTYRWNFFSVVTVRVWHRLIRILIQPNRK